MKKVYPSQTPEARRKANMDYREKNREKLLQYDRERYERRYAVRRLEPQTEEQKAANRLKTTKWRVDHPERVRTANAQWKKDHPGYERARKAGVPGSHTRQEWQALTAYFGHRCAYCGVGGKMTRDHVLPLSRPELHPTDSIDNILPACASCNSQKKNKTDWEFRRWLFDTRAWECSQNA